MIKKLFLFNKNIYTKYIRGIFKKTKNMYRPTVLVIGDESDNLNHHEEQKMQMLKEEMKKKKHVFLFIFMNTCGPCIETKPQWDEIPRFLNEKHPDCHDCVVARINYKFFGDLPNAGSEPAGFPTLRYVKDNYIEEYEDSGFSDRSTKSFVDWISNKMEKDMKKDTKSQVKTLKKSSSTRKSSSKKQPQSLTRKRKSSSKKSSLSSFFQLGGKWSMKYKKSIDCKKPKGFSQRQHCKYGRKNWRK